MTNGPVCRESLSYTILSLPNSQQRHNAASLSGAAVVRMRFEGAARDPAIVGVAQQPGVFNYLFGDDSAQWRVDIPTYAGILYQQIYPGIDLRYDGGNRTLKGTYTVAPGANPAQIRWRYDHGVHLAIDPASGALRISAPDIPAALVEQAPVAWQEIGGRRVPVAVRYTLDRSSLAGFALGAYDPAYALVIDPTLEYSTYLGGNRDDVPSGIAVDSAGNVYITGTTFSSTFPVAGALQPLPAGNYAWSDGFITKLTPDSKLVYSTYFGGSDDEEALGIAVDKAGSAYITGHTSSGTTNSKSFPIINAVQPTAGADVGTGGFDAFVTKLNPAGNAMVYSTYLGASGQESGRSIAVDSAGNAYITGRTRSTNFPRFRALQPAYSGPDPTTDWTGDAFVTKLNAVGSAFVYSTYLGGSADDRGNGIAADSLGNAYIAGTTESMNFPLKSPFQDVVRDFSEAFVTKISPNGAALIYSTYLGGNASDSGNAIAVDSAGSAYVTGETHSYNFPVEHPIQPREPGGLHDAFVIKLKPDGSGLVYGTHLGGRSADTGYGIAVDNAGNAYVTGTSASDNFPTSNPFWTYKEINYQAFVTRLNAAGTALYFSSQLGGDSYDFGYGIAVDAIGVAYITGETSSLNFPTIEALQKSKGNSNPSDKDGFVAKIDTSCVSDGPIVVGFGRITPCDGGKLYYPSGITASPVVVIDFSSASVVMDTLARGDEPDPIAPTLTIGHPLYRFTLSATDSTGHAVTRFLKPYTMSVRYTDAQLAAAGIPSASRLNVAFYNPETNAWVPLLPCAGCGVDRARHEVNVVADQVGEFALFGTPGVYLPLIKR